MTALAAESRRRVAADLESCCSDLVGVVYKFKVKEYTFFGVGGVIQVGRGYIL